MKIYINPQKYYKEMKQEILKEYDVEKDKNEIRYNDTSRRLKLFIFSIYLFLTISILSIIFSIINENIEILVNIGIFLIFVLFTYLGYKLSYYVHIKKNDKVFRDIINVKALSFIAILILFFPVLIVFYVLWRNLYILLFISSFILISFILIIIIRNILNKKV